MLPGARVATTLKAVRPSVAPWRFAVIKPFSVSLVLISLSYTTEQTHWPSSLMTSTFPSGCTSIVLSRYDSLPISPEMNVLVVIGALKPRRGTNQPSSPLSPVGMVKTVPCDAG